MPTIKRISPTNSSTKRAYRAPWYDTRKWRNLRINHLQAHPLCVECQKENRVEAAVILDHIKNVSSFPEKEREAAFWDTNNHQGLCRKHHDSKSGKEGKR